MQRDSGASRHVKNLGWIAPVESTTGDERRRR
jgi:hypothetical protein